MKEYEESTRQKINNNKSSFYNSLEAPKSKTEMIELLTGWKKGELLFQYLKGPIFHRGSRVKYFEPLVSKIRKKLNGWSQGYYLWHEESH